MTPRTDRLTWLWLVAFVAVLVLSMAKTLRLPIGYPASLMALNYEQGFIRRGLVGTVLFRGEGPITELWIAGVALVILALLMVAFTAVTWPILRAHPPLRLLAVLFASSLCIVYAASTMGYFDHLLLLIAALAVAVRGVAGRAVLLVAGGGLAILIHEAALLVTVPVLMLALWLALDRQGRTATAPVLLAGLALAGMTVAVVRLGGLEDAAVVELRQALQARADFPLTGLAFDILSADPVEHARAITGSVNLVAHLDSLVIALPALAPILGVALILARRMATGRMLLPAVAFAGLAPCLLRLAGSDIHRWDALAIGTSFLALALLLRETSGARAVPAHWPGLQPVLAVALAASAGSGTFLFAGQALDPWPFLGQRAVVMDWIGVR